MPEEVGATTSTPSPAEPGEGRQSVRAGAARLDEERRAVVIRRVILIGTIFAIGATGLYALLYLQEGTWQMLADGAGLALGLVCLTLARWSVHRGKLDAAGYWLLLTLVVTYCVSEIVWANETIYNAVGGTLLILLVGSLVLPRKWRAWLIAAGLYLTLILLVNLFEPLPRYDAVTESVVVHYFDLGLTVVLILVALWLIGRTFHRGTIRARLVIAFVTVALVPLVGAFAGTVLRGLRSDRQQSLDKLELVAELKESQVNSWVRTLQTELDTALNTEEIRTRVPMLLQEEMPHQVRTVARQKTRDHLRLLIIQRQQFEELLLMGLGGQVVVSTGDTQEGQNLSDTLYFREGLKRAYVQPPSYSPGLDGMSVVLAHPVTDDQGQVLGVLAGRASLATVSTIVREQSALGQAADVYLIDRNHALLTQSHFGHEGTYVHTQGADAAINGQHSGSEQYDNHQGQPVVGVYHWLPELEVALLAEQDQAEAFRETYTTLWAMGGVAMGTITIAVLTSLAITRSIATPLSNLAEAATQVARGNVEMVVEVDREDEMGVLARAFNSMTGQLRDLIGSLGQRVADRTRDLEKRSSYLEASAEVGRVVSSILDAEELMWQTVELIRERFQLYYVGLFLVDATGEWTVLRAGTGEAGKAMLERGHRIRIGEGMIGWSIANGQARIALDVGEDAVRLATDELPDTRSEAALPLQSRGRVIGALTIQSDRPAAFDEAAIALLQIMADYVAVALDNARLFAESQANLKAARRAYSELSREAWAELLRAQPDLGYRSDEQSITGAEDIWRPEMEQALQAGETIQGTLDDEANVEARQSLAVPIKVRGNVIGVLDTYKPAEGGVWTSEEIALLETLAEQLGLALESGRLYHDAQRRAARERLTREITDKMRRATGVEGIAQTAVDELFDVLGASRTFVRLGAPPTEPECGNAGHKE